MKDTSNWTHCLRDLEPTRPMIDWEKMLKLKLKRAYAIMEEEGLDAILAGAFDDVYYLTNWPRTRASAYGTMYNALVVRGKEPVVFSSETDSEHVIAECLADDIRILPPWTGKWIPELEKAFTDYGLIGKTVGLDGKTNFSFYQRLTKAMPKVTFKNAGPALNKMRMVKNEEEIKAWEFTLALVEAGTNAGIKAIKESWGKYTEIDICTIAQYELIRRGCTRTDIWCATGPNTIPLHRYPTDQPVRGREWTIIDGGGSFNGFRAEFGRSVWTGGKPQDEAKVIYRTVYEALEQAKAIMRPGVMTADLDLACLKVVREAGYIDCYRGDPFTGHCIGITNEQPYITSRYPELNTKLEAGVLVNLEPGIWKQGIGGIKLEDTFLITDNGYRMLTRAPYEEEMFS